LRQDFGIEISLSIFFMNLTVAELAQLVEKQRNHQTEPGAVS
jgi:hypothetical protein